MAEVPGSILTRVIFCDWIFGFHAVKLLMLILSFLCVREKLELSQKSKVLDKASCFDGFDFFGGGGN